MQTLDTFTRAYITCALFTSDDAAPGGCDYRYTGRFEELLPRIHPASLEAAKADCLKFQAENGLLLALAGDDEQNGFDFWFTRNRHGVGFWDRGYPESVAKPLTDAAHKFGERHCSIDADFIHIE